MNPAPRRANLEARRALEKDGVMPDFTQQARRTCRMERCRWVCDRSGLACIECNTRLFGQGPEATDLARLMYPPAGSISRFPDRADKSRDDPPVPCAVAGASSCRAEPCPLACIARPGVASARLVCRQVVKYLIVCAESQTSPPPNRCTGGMLGAQYCAQKCRAPLPKERRAGRARSPRSSARTC